MTALPIVLDAAGLSEIAMPGKSGPHRSLFALLDQAWANRRDVLVPAVVCAELCRGVARTRQVESFLARHNRGRNPQAPVVIVDTDFSLARLVGTVLESSKAPSRDIVDAHVVAICVSRGGGVIVTSDPDDHVRLSAPFIGTRIIIRSVAN